MQTEDDILASFIEQEREFPIFEEWSDRVATALEHLSASERQLIQWVYIEGLTQAECAAEAEISVRGIKKRREQMLVKLRRC